MATKPKKKTDIQKQVEDILNAGMTPRGKKPPPEFQGKAPVKSNLQQETEDILNQIKRTKDVSKPPPKHHGGGLFAGPLGKLIADATPNVIKRPLSKYVGMPLMSAADFAQKETAIAEGQIARNLVNIIPGTFTTAYGLATDINKARGITPYKKGEKPFPFTRGFVSGAKKQVVTDISDPLANPGNLAWDIATIYLPAAKVLARGARAGRATYAGRADIAHQPVPELPQLPKPGEGGAPEGPAGKPTIPPDVGPAGPAAPAGPEGPLPPEAGGPGYQEPTYTRAVRQELNRLVAERDKAKQAWDQAEHAIRATRGREDIHPSVVEDAQNRKKQAQARMDSIQGEINDLVAKAAQHAGAPPVPAEGGLTEAQKGTLASLRNQLVDTTNRVKTLKRDLNAANKDPNVLQHERDTIRKHLEAAVQAQGTINDQIAKLSQVRTPGQAAPAGAAPAGPEPTPQNPTAWEHQPIISTIGTSEKFSSSYGTTHVVGTSKKFPDGERIGILRLPGNAGYRLATIDANSVVTPKGATFDTGQGAAKALKIAAEQKDQGRPLTMENPGLHNQQRVDLEGKRGKPVKKTGGTVPPPREGLPGKKGAELPESDRVIGYSEGHTSPGTLSRFVQGDRKKIDPAVEKRILANGAKKGDIVFRQYANGYVRFVGNMDALKAALLHQLPTVPVTVENIGGTSHEGAIQFKLSKAWIAKMLSTKGETPPEGGYPNKREPVKPKQAPTAGGVQPGITLSSEAPGGAQAAPGEVAPEGQPPKTAKPAKGKSRQTLEKQLKETEAKLAKAEDANDERAISKLHQKVSDLRGEIALLPEAPITKAEGFRFRVYDKSGNNIINIQAKSEGDVITAEDVAKELESRGHAGFTIKDMDGHDVTPGHSDFTFQVTDAAGKSKSVTVRAASKDLARKEFDGRGYSKIVYKREKKPSGEVIQAVQPKPKTEPAPPLPEGRAEKQPPPQSEIDKQMAQARAEGAGTEFTVSKNPGKPGGWSRVTRGPSKEAVTETFKKMGFEGFTVEEHAVPAVSEGAKEAANPPKAEPRPGKQKYLVEKQSTDPNAPSFRTYVTAKNPSEALSAASKETGFDKRPEEPRVFNPAGHDVTPGSKTFKVTTEEGGKTYETVVKATDETAAIHKVSHKFAPYAKHTATAFKGKITEGNLGRTLEKVGKAKPAGAPATAERPPAEFTLGEEGLKPTKAAKPKKAPPKVHEVKVMLRNGETHTMYVKGRPQFIKSWAMRQLPDATDFFGVKWAIRTLSDDEAKAIGKRAQPPATKAEVTVEKAPRSVPGRGEQGQRTVGTRTQAGPGAEGETFSQKLDRLGKEKAAARKAWEDKRAEVEKREYARLRAEDKAAGRDTSGKSVQRRQGLAHTAASRDPEVRAAADAMDAADLAYMDASNPEAAAKHREFLAAHPRAPVEQAPSSESISPKVQAEVPAEWPPPTPPAGGGLQLGGEAAPQAPGGRATRAMGLGPRDLGIGDRLLTNAGIPQESRSALSVAIQKAWRDAGNKFQVGNVQKAFKDVFGKDWKKHYDSWKPKYDASLRRMAENKANREALQSAENAVRESQGKPPVRPTLPVGEMGLTESDLTKAGVPKDKHRNVRQNVARAFNDAHAQGVEPSHAQMLNVFTHQLGKDAGQAAFDAWVKNTGHQFPVLTPEQEAARTTTRQDVQSEEIHDVSYTDSRGKRVVASVPATDIKAAIAKVKASGGKAAKKATKKEIDADLKRMGIDPAKAGDYKVAVRRALVGLWDQLDAENTNSLAHQDVHRALTEALGVEKGNQVFSKIFSVSGGSDAGQLGKAIAAGVREMIRPKHGGTFYIATRTKEYKGVETTYHVTVPASNSIVREVQYWRYGLYRSDVKGLRAEMARRILRATPKAMNKKIAREIDMINQFVESQEASQTVWTRAEAEAEQKKYFQQRKEKGEISAGDIWDTGQQLALMATILLKPGYFLPNFLGQATVLLSDMQWWIPNLAHNSKLSKAVYEMNPGNLPRVRAAMMDSATRSLFSGAEPKIPGASYKVAIATQRLQQFYSRWLDSPFRDSAFWQEARRQGFTTKEAGDRLLNDPTLSGKFYEISRRANANAIDFSMYRPFERKLVRRLVFFYPWFKGASKYSARFLFEHPIQSQIYRQMAIENQKRNESIFGRMVSYEDGVFVAGFHHVPLLGKQPLVINTNSMTVLGTLGTTLDVFLKGGLGTAPPSEMPIEFANPILSASIAAAMGVDPFTRKAYPAGSTIQGRFFSKLGGNIAGLTMLQNVAKAHEYATGQKDVTKVLMPYSWWEPLGRFFIGPTPYTLNKVEQQSRAQSEAQATMSRTQKLVIKSKQYMDTYNQAAKAVGVEVPDLVKQALAIRAAKMANRTTWAESKGSPLNPHETLLADLGFLVGMKKLSNAQAKTWMRTWAHLPDTEIAKQDANLAKAFMYDGLLSDYTSQINMRMRAYGYNPIPAPPS